MAAMEGPPRTPMSAESYQRRLSGRHSSAMGTMRSVAITPPKSPAMNRVPSASLMKQVETPPSPSKWQMQHEQSTMRQLTFMRAEKKEQIKSEQKKVQNLARKIPVELLAKEWLSENKVSLDTRAFLVENVLPTLILGTEKLLVEVEKQGITERNEFKANFNPINYLAQYLMRNNPRYCNFAEASPYVRSLREVSENLKNQIFQLEDNRLARIKNEARQKREARERAIEAKRQEKARRETVLMQQFLEWSATIEGKLEMALIQSALKSFSDMAEYLPADLQPLAQYSQSLGLADESGRTLNAKDYVEYVTGFVDEFPPTLFDQFVAHLGRCANAYKAELQREQRKVTLSNLFVMCDHTGVGVLDRHRIISLFESFYDHQDPSVRETGKLRNPRKWPVVEVDEADSESEDESGETTQKTAMTVTSHIQPLPVVKVDSKPKAVDKPDEDQLPSKEKHEAEIAEKDIEKVPSEEEQGQDSDQLEREEQVGEDNEQVLSSSKQNITQGITEGATFGAAQGPARVESAKELVEEESESLPLEEETDKVPQKEAEPPAGESTSTTEAAIEPVTEKRLPTRGGAYSVSFAEGTNMMQRERTILETRGTGSQSQMSAFDENVVNMSQFVQITETFLGDFPVLELFQALCRYMRDGYVETEEEKMARLMRAHREALLLRQRNRLDAVFEKWDNEGSGYLDIEEIETIIHKYKDGLEKLVISRAKAKFLQKLKQETGHGHDHRLTKSEFRTFFNTIVEELPGESSFDYFVDFVESCVERTYAEKIRGEARKKWLQQIIGFAETSAASLETVFRSVFQALYRDAETHGNGKVISANIALLELNTKQPERGNRCLRYVAATSDDAGFLLNKYLYKDMRGISFHCVESGKPLHVPRVSNHGNIQFWNPERSEEDSDGSFVVIPLKDKKKRVFGVMGIDTLRDPQAKSIFITHEIQFYQGVAKAFSISYHKVDSKRKTMRITEAAVSWICRRSPNIHEINVYLVEPDGKNEDYVLRRMMVAQGEKADVKLFDTPSRLERKENLFRDYLFKCVDNSETVTADAYGQRHFAFPLRGSDGRVVAVIDISTGQVKQIPKHEKKEIVHMLKLVQRAQKEIMKEYDEDEKTVVLEAEKENEEVRTEILFDRLMLMDLRKKVTKLDSRAYAELKSYKEPPQVIHNILKATLSLFFPDLAAKNAFDDWQTCKMHINSELNNKISVFDPTVEGSERIPAEIIGKPLQDVPHGLVGKHSSVPAEYLYNWIFVCLSLIQHTKKMRQTDELDAKTKGMLPTGMTPDFNARNDDDE